MLTSYMNIRRVFMSPETLDQSWMKGITYPLEGAKRNVLNVRNERAEGGGDGSHDCGSLARVLAAGRWRLPGDRVRVEVFKAQTQACTSHTHLLVLLFFPAGVLTLMCVFRILILSSNILSASSVCFLECAC